jgi:hypothetical protein
MVEPTLKLINRTARLIFGVFLLAGAVRAQSGVAKPTAACAAEIPTGVKVVRVPDAEQKEVTLSDFSVSAAKDPETYDLSMHIKNGTDNWCITSLAVTYVFGDARGQEWTANEYPAVMQFKAGSKSAQPPKTGKPAPEPVPDVGMPPGKDERRTLSDVYSYIQPRPSGYFDGFHLIAAEIKYCVGYTLTEHK